MKDLDKTFAVCKPLFACECLQMLALLRQRRARCLWRPLAGACGAWGA